MENRGLSFQHFPKTTEEGAPERLKMVKTLSLPPGAKEDMDKWWGNKLRRGFKVKYYPKLASGKKEGREGTRSK